MLLAEKVKSRIRDVKDFPKPGILFKDITPVFNDPELVNEMVQSIVSRFRGEGVQAVAGIEARGFIFGSIIAHELKCRFIPVRKAGKLPYKTKSKEYSLEYGSNRIEMHEDAIFPGERVLIHDDLLATGGTASAAGDLVKEMGGEIVGFSFIINLGFLPGYKNILDRFAVKPFSIIEY